MAWAVSRRRFCCTSLTQLVTVWTISRAVSRGTFFRGAAFVRCLRSSFFTIRMVFFSDISANLCYFLLKLLFSIKRYFPKRVPNNSCLLQERSLPHRLAL